MIGNVQRSRHAPAIDPQIAYEDPVRVKPQTGSPPGRDAGWEWRRKTARLHQLSDFVCFLAGQGIEIAKHYDWAIVPVRRIQ